LFPLGEKRAQEVRAYTLTLHLRQDIKRAKKDRAFFDAPLRPAHIAPIHGDDAGFIQLEPFSKTLILTGLIPSE
jgi:hypothetical protein